MKPEQGMKRIKKQRQNGEVELYEVRSNLQKSTQAV